MFWNCVVNFPTDTYRYLGLKLNENKNYMIYWYLYIWWCSFICPSSEDNRVLLWDVRSSKGSLMSLDQFNGQEVPTFLSGEIFENYYFVLNFSHCCQCSCFGFFIIFFGGCVGCWDLMVGSSLVRKITTMIITHSSLWAIKDSLICI